MANQPKQPRKWQRKLRLSFDHQAMPEILKDNPVSKFMMAREGFKSSNCDRATKFMRGASTDMEDILRVCTKFDIDLAQFLLLPDGTHPVILAKMPENAEPQNVPDKPAEDANEKGTDPIATPQTEPIDEDRISNSNASDLIELIGTMGKDLAAANLKIHLQYERIVELTAQVARLQAEAAREMTAQRPVQRGMVSDESEMSYSR